MKKETTVLKDVNDGKVTSRESSHPVGTGVGTIAGASAGFMTAGAGAALAGSAFGPAGAALGAAVGGVVGAMAGHEVAAEINPKEEDLFWRTNYAARPYVIAGAEYETYQPAYKYGVDAFGRYEGRNFDTIEPDLSRDWDTVRGESDLEWDEARLATRDAYDRLGTRYKKPE